VLINIQKGSVSETTVMITYRDAVRLKVSTTTPKMPIADVQSAFVTIPLLRDAIDTFYKYVLQRAIAKMNILAPNISCSQNGDTIPFQFGGICQARDWPMQQAILNAPYLLLQTESPIPYGRTAVSQYRPQMRMGVMWAWMVQGDNVAANSQSANRGNKYGINIAIMQAMQHSHYPGFTEKLQWGIVDNGSGQPINTSVHYNPPDMVRWSMPRFVDKIDRTSGLLYCSGSVSLISFAPEITQ
jgi:hypothetical protein